MYANKECLWSNVPVVVLAIALCVFAIWKLQPTSVPPAALTDYALASVSSGVDAHIGGHPIDSGYEPQMLMDAYPSLVPQDFDGAEATQGKYFIGDDGLDFRSTASSTVSTAERGLTARGIMYALQSAATRLSMPISSEADVDVLLSRLGAAAPYPATLTADQVIVADAHPSSLAPAGFRAVKDIQLNITFDAPVDWKPQYLPEGDGHASIVSPDFSNPLATMTGAYLHYYFQSPPDQFIGKPDAYLALLKQGSTWTQMSLDGHVAYLAKPSKGYTMVVSELSDDSFLTIAFDDTTGTYGAVFDEFLRSFHVQ